MIFCKAALKQCVYKKIWLDLTETSKQNQEDLLCIWKTDGKGKYVHTLYKDLSYLGTIWKVIISVVGSIP